MTTPAYDYERVRVAVVEHVETMGGWKVAAHLFGGADQQGAIMGGARSFDVAVGASGPAPGAVLSDRSGAEYLATQIIVRIRQSYPPLQSPVVQSRTLQDRRDLERHLRARTPALLSGMDVRWLGTDAPTVRVTGFLDTDLRVEVRHWSVVGGPVGSGQAGGVR